MTYRQTPIYTTLRRRVQIIEHVELYHGTTRTFWLARESVPYGNSYRMVQTTFRKLPRAVSYAHKADRAEQVAA